MSNKLTSIFISAVILILPTTVYCILRRLGKFRNSGGKEKTADKVVPTITPPLNEAISSTKTITYHYIPVIKEPTTRPLTEILKSEALLYNLELLYGLKDWLISEELLDSQTLDDLERENQNREESCIQLLPYINDSNLKKFLDGLRETKQSHLAAFIECKINDGNPENHTEDDWPMDDFERNTINKLQTLLVKDLATNEVLDELLSENCINDQHTDFIRQHNTKYEKNRELLGIMRRRSKADVKLFWKFVVKCSSHLKDIVEKFRVPGNTMTLVKVNLQNDLTQKEKERISEKASKAGKPIRGRSGEGVGGGTKINICVSGDAVYAAVEQAGGDEADAGVVSDDVKYNISKTLAYITRREDIICEAFEIEGHHETLNQDENETKIQIVKGTISP